MHSRRYVGVFDDDIGLGKTSFQVTFLENGFMVGTRWLRHLLEEADSGTQY